MTWASRPTNGCSTLSAVCELTVNVNGAEFGALAADLLGAGHALRFRARGGSMHPAIRDGDALWVSPSAPVRRGDVALCRAAAGRVLAHRVVCVTEAGIQTQGDALACPDPPVPWEQVLGRVTAVERAGRRLSPRRPVLLRRMRRVVGGLWRRVKVIVNKYS